MSDYEICDKYNLPYSVIEPIYSSIFEGAKMSFEDAVKLFILQ